MPSIAKHKLVESIRRLLSTFNSRNNDTDGYWSIGKLCLYSQEVKLKTVSFDLFQKIEDAPTKQIAYLIGFYRSKYEGFLESLGVIEDEDMIKNVIISLDFHEVDEGEYTYITLVKVICLDGQEHQLSEGGVCWPHDPLLEHQSARASN